MGTKQIKEDYLEIVTCYRSLININKNKLPKYCEYLYDNIDDNVLNGHEKSG